MICRRGSIPGRDFQGPLTSSRREFSFLFGDTVEIGDLEAVKNRSSETRNSWESRSVRGAYLTGNEAIASDP